MMFRRRWPRPRRTREIDAAELEMCDRVWLNRHVERGPAIVEGPEDIVHGSLEAANRVLDAYGEEALVDNLYELGLLEGKLSALRWVLGYEWDFLDT